MFRKIKWLFHPISIFVLAQICWGLLMFIWIRWYILRSQEIKTLIEKIPHPTNPSGQWIILVQGCILMGFILIGLYMIFVSQRRIFKLAKMQDAILSNVTHELKTPLASIRLYTETMLLRNVSEQDRFKFLKYTLSESERLQKLIDTVLISARLQSSPTPTNFSRADINEILQTCYSKAKVRFGDVRKFVFQFNCSENDDLTINGNPQHLSTLFDNLIDNAVKYSPNNGLISVEISLKKENIVIAVKDSGCGIEKQNLKKIFEKFFRAENKFHSFVKGSGLGLSVCQSIVHEHGGKIFALSEGLDKGTQFYVELKRYDTDN